MSPAAAHPSAWSTDVSAGELAALKAELARQADELAQLKALVQRLCFELGLHAPSP
jgi:hypothetical protein